MTLLRLATIFWLLLQPAAAFIFRFTSTPTQCEETSVVWQGGQPPYRILLIPVGHQEQGVERRVIFDRTFDDRREGTFTFPFPAGSRFVAVMSDADGFGTGGTSRIMTVGRSGDSSCLPTSFSTPKFYFYLDTPTPSQCGTMAISWGGGGSPPVHIYGVIPQGDAFEIGRSSGTGFDWTANVRAGTPFMFVAGDSTGAGTGGSTDVTNILSGSSACLGSDSPSTTPDSSNGSVGPLPGGGGGNSGGGNPTSTRGNGGSGGDDVTASDGNSPTGIPDPSEGSEEGSGGDPGFTVTTDSNGQITTIQDGIITVTDSNGQVTTVRDGSGGGTVRGPPGFPLPTDGVPIATPPEGNAGSKLKLILGLVFGILGFIAFVVLATIWYKSRQQGNINRKSSIHHRRLLSNLSDTNLNEDDGTVPLPPNSPYADPWAARSIESLGSAYRSTPFVWPRPGSLRNGSSSSGFSPTAGVAPGMVRRRGTGEGGGRPTTNPIHGLGDSSGSSGLPSHKSDLPASYTRLRNQQSAANAVGTQSVTSSTRGDQGSHDEHPAYQPVPSAEEDFGEMVEQVLTPLSMARAGSMGGENMTAGARSFWGPRPPPPLRIPTGASGTSAMSEIPPTYTSLKRQSRKD